MDWIDQGILKQKNSMYQVRSLVSDDIPALILLQQLALEELDDSDTLQPLDQSEFAYILEGNGGIIGAFVDKHLIAFRALRGPALDDEEHLGLALGLENILDEIIYQEISVVHPFYRGNQLQQKLATLIMK